MMLMGLRFQISFFLMTYASLKAKEIAKKKKKTKRIQLME